MPLEILETQLSRKCNPASWFSWYCGVHNLYADKYQFLIFCNICIYKEFSNKFREWKETLALVQSLINILQQCFFDPTMIIKPFAMSSKWSNLSFLLYTIHRMVSVDFLGTMRAAQQACLTTSCWALGLVMQICPCCVLGQKKCLFTFAKNSSLNWWIYVLLSFPCE